MSKRRYEQWAGTGIPKEWKSFGFKDPSGIVWPIVDTETCGPIDGFPSPDQWYLVAFDSDVQAKILALLNEQLHG